LPEAEGGKVRGGVVVAGVGVVAAGVEISGGVAISGGMAIALGLAIAEGAAGVGREPEDGGVALGTAGDCAAVVRRELIPGDASPDVGPLACTIWPS
jgi:hypothetical protein